MGRTTAHCLVGLGLLVATVATAAAKHTPFSSAPPARLPEVSDIFMGPAGAIMESDYFRAPHRLFKRGHTEPCRLHRDTTDNVPRSAYSCR